MFQRKHILSKRVLFILFGIIALLIPLPLTGMPDQPEINTLNILAKVVTGIIVLMGLLILTNLTSLNKTFYLIFFGLAFYFYAIEVGLLEEYILRPQSGVYEIVEHYGVISGMLLICFGFYTLVMEYKDSNQWRYKMATAAGQVGVWDWNLETHEYYADSHLKAMLGYKDNEVPNRLDDWSQMVHPEDQELMVKKALSYLNGEQSHYEVVRRMIHKDGSIKWFLTRGSALTDENGKPYRIIGTDIDISQQRMLEQQLIQSQKMEAVGRLTGGVAHDFNNLLAAIIGSASILEKKLHEHPQELKQVKRIQKSANRGAELTRKLLGFSRNEIKAPCLIDVKHCVENMIDLIEHTIDKRITINKQFCEETVLTMANEDQLELAIMNLAVNGCDAINSVVEQRKYNELRFRILVEHIGEPFAEKYEIQPGHQYIRLSVGDTGTGIPEDMLQEIFEPFFTTKDLEKGTGLGLSITYGIVKSYGGAITVESKVGYGSDFHIFLPKYEG